VHKNKEDVAKKKRNIEESKAKEEADATTTMAST
jgi:hypothetical protein